MFLSDFIFIVKYENIELLVLMLLAVCNQSVL